MITARLLGPIAASAMKSTTEVEKASQIPNRKIRIFANGIFFKENQRGGEKSPVPFGKPVYLLLKTILSSFTSTVTLPPSLYLCSSNSTESGLSTYFCSARRSGRAPKAGS